MQFEIIMQHNPYEHESLDLITINKCIDFVWDDFTIANYNFFVLSRVDIASYMQMKIDDEAYFVIEVLEEGRVYQLKLDDKELVKSIFKGFYLLFDLDLSVFKDITHNITQS